MNIFTIVFSWTNHLDFIATVIVNAQYLRVQGRPNKVMRTNCRTSGKPFLKIINLDQFLKNFELQDFAETMATDWDTIKN